MEKYFIFTLFISIGAIVFTYFGYPFTLFLLSFLFSRGVKKSHISPRVSLIITAFNEENRITEKLENTKQIVYPRQNLQIIVASDGSTDKTNDIVKSYEQDGVTLYNVKNRAGKENAQKEALQTANGEIIVFSDVATMIEANGLQEIVNNFADSSVGCVSSSDVVIGQDGKPCGEGAYVKYEMWLRRQESKIYSLVGLSGSFFAARKVVCKDFSATMQSDFRTLLNSMRLKLRGVIDPHALGMYKDIQDESREFSRKVRTVVRGLAVFFNNLEFFNIFKYGFFTYQYFSHKLLRWLVPFFMILAIISNVFILHTHITFFIIGICQLAFYISIILSYLLPFLSKIFLFKIPKYFFIANLSIFIAWIKYLRGDRVTMWKPSVR